MVARDPATLFPTIYDDLRALNAQMLAKQPVKRIVAYLAASAMDDFVAQALVAAAYAKRLPMAYTLIIHRADGGLRDATVACLPAFQGVLSASAGGPLPVLVDWFDVGAHPTVVNPDPQWYERSFHKPDVLLLPSMLDREVARLGILDQPGPMLRLPADRTAPPGALNGMAAERWFAVLAAPPSEPWRAVARHIVDVQGGRVLRLAEAGGEAWPEMAGVTDLAGADPWTILWAASRARYGMGTDGHALGLVSAGGVSCAAWGAKQPGRLVWKSTDIIATFDSDPLALADRLAAATADRAGLPGPRPEAVAAPLDGFDFPIPMTDRPWCVVLP